MAKSPFFSIVIPAWNRGRELFHTLRTCLDQDFEADNFEIIVSDNCSTDNIPAVIDSLSTDRVRYVRTDLHLPMTDSWNFALAHARGKYVGILATDDGYCLDLLSESYRILQQEITPVLTFQSTQYHWPSSPHVQMRDQMIVTNYAFSDGPARADGLIDEAFSSLDYARLPTGMNSFCKRDFLQEVIARYGSVFSSFFPDVYAAIFLGSQVPQIYTMNQPMFVAGFSSDSNGASMVTDTESSRKFYRAKDEELFPGIIHSDPPLLTTGILDAMLKARKTRGDADPFSRVNVEQYVKFCYRDADAFPDYVAKDQINAAIDEYVENCHPEICRQIKRYRSKQRSRNTLLRSGWRNLKLWSTPVRHALYRKHRPGRRPTGDQVIHCRALNIENVYDAAVYTTGMRSSQRKKAA